VQSRGEGRHATRQSQHHFIKIGPIPGVIAVAGEDKDFVKPTVFANITNDMTIAREEIFGPLLCMLTYENDAEAILIANDTPYGLQAYFISSNLERATVVASQIEAGRVVINGARSHSAVRLIQAIWNWTRIRRLRAPGL
jgi:acyl-CoA reductase-like NAD-dependent aldehyde dehydrogenase